MMTDVNVAPDDSDPSECLETSIVYKISDLSDRPKGDGRSIDANSDG
jgi:hypothetical protein